MPRKKGSDAQSEERDARRARIRYLLRNHDFRDEFNALRRQTQDAPSEDGRFFVARRRETMKDILSYERIVKGAVG
jgi:hypothetical protein